MLMMQFGNLSTDTTKYNTRLFAEKVIPKLKGMRPAAFIYHKIRYAGVFEEGAVIGGQPLLWLPLPTVPLRRGRPMTPSQYAHCARRRRPDQRGTAKDR